MKPSFLIVGLGNPGASYARTRHNAGFLGVELLAEHYEAGEWKDAQKFASVLCEVQINGQSVLLVQPHTYMNRSGETVRKIVDFYKLNPVTQVLIVMDEIDLPLGDHRLRMKGSAGTHNGLKSVVEQFGEDVPRLRIGVGPVPEQVDLASWVLSAFSDEEMDALMPVFQSLPGIVETFIKESIA